MTRISIALRAVRLSTWALLLLAAPALGQMTMAPASAETWTDTVQAGPFDNGKMWTFEYPPTAYLQETYGIAADEDWFARARLGALRIPGCSASFVSPQGLVMTNHHCARESVSQVSQEGENLLDNGFYAATIADERRIEDYYADQLIEIVDVTDEVDGAVDGAGSDPAARSAAREEISETIRTRLLDARGGEDAGYEVEVISLYSGGRTSAYVFRRYDDVRLVMAPELQIGFFGGDPDNFTYPRYNLDMSFMRVFGEDGNPLQPEQYFPFNTDGVQEGDVVFVIGNPGSTSRIQTVAELEFRRDVSDKAVLEFIESRMEALSEYIEMDPERAEELDLRNQFFSLSNSQKAYNGQIQGLHDPYIVARRQAQERDFAAALGADPALVDRYGTLIADMAALQDQKRPFAPEYGALLGATSAELGAATLVRALYAFQYVAGRSQGAPEEMLEEVRTELLAVPQLPIELEEILVRARLEDFERSFGPDSPVVQGILQGRSAEGLAAVVVNNSVLSDSVGTAEAVENGTLSMSDPAIQIIQGVLPRMGAFQGALSQLAPREEEIAADLGRARFAVYGTDVPPDATFSLRIADGVVTGYNYNGTRAPIFTTFWGMYDRHFSHAGEADWDLPERWKTGVDALDLSTPVNFVSTADIIGGNSGSPVLNADLEVVGLVFDGNIESLPGDYIYLDDTARTVSVDARGILAALGSIYGAQRLVEEMTGG